MENPIKSAIDSFRDKVQEDMLRKYQEWLKDQIGDDFETELALQRYSVTLATNCCDGENSFILSEKVSEFTYKFPEFISKPGLYNPDNPKKS